MRLQTVLAAFGHVTRNHRILRRNLTDDEFAGIVHAIAEMEDVEIFFGDVSELGKFFEIDDGTPEFFAEKHDRNLFPRLVRLNEREHFEKLVHRPEPAGEGNQRMREVQEPVLANKEVTELEIKFRRNMASRIRRNRAFRAG